MNRLFRREATGTGRFARHDRTSPEVALGDPVLSNQLTKIHPERGHPLVPRSSRRWPSVSDARSQPTHSVPIQAMYTCAGSSWHLTGYDPDTQTGYGYVCLDADVKRAQWREFSLAELEYRREGRREFLVCRRDYPRGRTGADAMAEVRRGDNAERLEDANAPISVPSTWLDVI